MHHTAHALRRGAVLRSGTSRWIVWQSPAQSDPRGMAVCMPIVGQHLPLHRLDYELQDDDAPWLRGQRLLVRIANVRRIATRDMLVAAYATSECIDRMQAQIAHVARSWAIEERQAMRP